MIEHSLNGAIERARRASKHLDDLRAALMPLGNKNTMPFDPDKIVIREAGTNFSFNPTLNVAYIVPILIGEICYNLRSALDYLIYELTKLDSPGIPQHQTQFPIEDRKKGFIHRCGGWLKGLNQAHIASIERLQPYCGCDWIL